LSKSWEKFSTWTFCKNIFMVFLNSPCRETPKNVLKKKVKKKKVGWWVGVSEIWLMYGGVRRFFFGRPLGFVPAAGGGGLTPHGLIPTSWWGVIASPLGAKGGCPCLHQAAGRLRKKTGEQTAKTKPKQNKEHVLAIALSEHVRALPLLILH
jgi:hypothetical protein